MSTRQHSIDLLPAEIYAQSQAGLRMGRFGAASAVVIVMLVVAATHSRWMLRREQINLFETSAQATQVLVTEAKAAELRKALSDTRQFMALYERVAFPVDLSAVLATVIRTLPESVTLEQIDLNAGARQTGRTSRSKGEKNSASQRSSGVDQPPRILTGEVSGFAASDQHIAELVSRLTATPPFRDISLDFSRTRDVHGQSAREFRLSFRIDLDAAYQRSEVRSQKSEVSRQTPEVSGERATEGDQDSAASELKSGPLTSDLRSLTSDQEVAHVE